MCVEVLDSVRQIQEKVYGIHSDLQTSQYETDSKISHLWMPTLNTLANYNVIVMV